MFIILFKIIKLLLLMNLLVELCQIDVGVKAYIKQWKQKKDVPIRQNTETAASITYQNFFLLYPKLSGMTGTAKTAEVEFEKIYNLPVDEIPTARPNLRKDLPDLVYKDELSKWTCNCKECKIFLQISTNFNWYNNV